MGTITHNGRKYTGNSLTVTNNKVYIDGKLVDDNERSLNDETTAIFRLLKRIFTIKLTQRIEISGDVKITATDSILTINGDLTIANNDQLSNCDITCGDLNAHDITCGDLNADKVDCNVIICSDLNADAISASDIAASGDLNCDDIKGNVTVSGDLSCDDIRGSVDCKGDINCDNIN